MEEVATVVTTAVMAELLQATMAMVAMAAMLLVVSSFDSVIPSSSFTLNKYQQLMLCSCCSRWHSF